MNIKLGFPTGREYLKEFVMRTILPSARKQSNTLFFVKGAGRNSLLRYINAYKAEVEGKLDLKIGNIVFLTIESYDSDVLIESWIRMIRAQGYLSEDLETTSPFQLLESLANKQLRILLCVWLEAEKFGIEFLEALRKVNPIMVDFQFAIPFEVETSEIKNYLGSLTEFALQNVWYMPFYMEEDIDAVVDSQVVQGFAEVSESQTENIKKLSGGYPKLIRFFLRNLDKIDVSSWQDAEVKHFFDDIWDSLSNMSRSELFNLLKEKVEVKSDFLVKTGLVQRIDDKYEFFSPLFEKYVAFLFESKPPAIAENNGTITVSGDSIDLLLSGQEAQVFSLLYKHKGNLVSRDNVAEIMWGSDWEDKYSDWAIDQLMSRIRKKIGDRSSKGLIKTIRGKGLLLEI